MGCHFLHQGIFPTQGSNLGLPHCRQTLYHLSYQRSPKQSEAHINCSMNVCWPRKWVKRKFRLLFRFLFVGLSCDFGVCGAWTTWGPGCDDLYGGWLLSLLSFFPFLGSAPFSLRLLHPLPPFPPPPPISTTSHCSPSSPTLSFITGTRGWKHCCPLGGGTSAPRGQSVPLGLLSGMRLRWWVRGAG